MFGLLCINGIETFSLQSISVTCSINNLLVTCSSDFVYNNDSDVSMEALFSFPLEGSCMVYQFMATIDGKTIGGVCKELEEARNMYKAAKEAGHKTAMIERNTGMTDTFKCRIGNIPMNSEAKISLKFVMELSLSLVKNDLEDADRFNLCLPLILRPRYTPAGYVGDSEVYSVSNKYDYDFRASISGNKVIKCVVSDNYTLKTIFTDVKKTCAEVTLESKYDGTHDLDIGIDYVKMRVPTVIYEHGTISKHCKVKQDHGAFYRPDVAMLNFLPDFEKNSGALQKFEIVFLVDRSGSMGGSNIKHAKQCLLIFLKSLPTNCKFQIYGFGSEFDKVFSQPTLYDEDSIVVAMNYQKNIDADFGGTELMKPLKDLYDSSLSSDYTRVVFLLTDGDVGNQDEVFSIVRRHNNSTRLFTIGIGDGVSTSLVQKVAESGLGKSVFVRNTKMLSASVIELLDIALNSDMFTDCKIEWQCPNDVSVVMVPSKPGPIFSNYFLTFFCMIYGLKDGDSIKCDVSGHVNNTLTTLSMEVTGKNGISDDEFRVHRLLAKYKIDEMTSQIEDGKEDLKKSLIELSLEVNMVTNYTTFVAIDHDAPDRALISYEEDIYMASCGMALCYDAPDGMMLTYGNDLDACEYEENECMYEANSEYEENECMYEANSEVQCIFDEDEIEAPRMMPQLQMLSEYLYGGEIGDKGVLSCEVEGEDDDIILFLAEKQHINGSWRFDEEVIRHIGADLSKMRAEKPESIGDDVWTTVLVYLYLVEKLAIKEKEWRLFGQKAKQWIESNISNSMTLNLVMEKGRQLI